MADRRSAEAGSREKPGLTEDDAKLPIETASGTDTSNPGQQQGGTPPPP
jgi:hypothetical protein